MIRLGDQDLAAIGDSGWEWLDTEKSRYFMCGICQGILANPCTAGCTQHVFCYKCLIGYARTKSIEQGSHSPTFPCPICRRECSAGSIQRQDFLANIIRSESVKCTNVSLCIAEDPSCDWIGPLSELKAHQAQCPLELIKCKWCNLEVNRMQLECHENQCDEAEIKCMDCGEIGILRKLMVHHTVSECSNRKSSCPDCNLSIHKRDLWDHRLICAERIVFCPYGCMGGIKQRDLQSHMNEFVAQHMETMQCRYEIKLASLQTDNRKLKELIVDLSKRVDTLQKERMEEVDSNDEEEQEQEEYETDENMHCDLQSVD